MKIFAALVLALSLSSQVYAQNACNTRDVVINVLTEKYGERLLATGVQSADSVVEIWVNDEKSTWSILVTNKNGITCLVSSGQNWTQHDNPKNRI